MRRIHTAVKSSEISWIMKSDLTYAIFASYCFLLFRRKCFIQKSFAGIIYSVKIMAAVISVQPAADRGSPPVDFLIVQVEREAIKDPVREEQCFIVLQRKYPPFYGLLDKIVPFIRGVPSIVLFSVFRCCHGAIMIDPYIVLPVHGQPVTGPVRFTKMQIQIVIPNQMIADD